MNEDGAYVWDEDDDDPWGDGNDYDDDPWDDEPCRHDHDEECEDEWGYSAYCSHQHCFACGGCECPGYCDDYQTYNLRPAETGEVST